MEDEGIIISSINDLSTPINNISNNIKANRVAKLFEQKQDNSTQDIDEKVMIDAASRVWGRKSKTIDENNN